MSSFFKHQPKFKPHHKKQQPTARALDETKTEEISQSQLDDAGGYYHHQPNEDVLSSLINTKDNNNHHCPCLLPDSGAMLGCENDDCPYQWFHPKCLEIVKMPEEDEAWYCPACRDTPDVREKIRRLEEYGEKIGEDKCARVNLDGVMVVNEGEENTKQDLCSPKQG